MCIFDCVFPNKLIFRLPLHEEWRGVRDEDLSSVSGIPGCVFVHTSGFIGGNKTLEGAMTMAWTTIEKNRHLIK